MPFFPQTQIGKEEKKWREKEQYLEKNLEKTRERLQEVMRKLQLEDGQMWIFLAEEEKEKDGEDEDKPVK